MSSWTAQRSQRVRDPTRAGRSDCFLKPMRRRLDATCSIPIGVLACIGARGRIANAFIDAIPMSIRASGMLLTPSPEAASKPRPCWIEDRRRSALRGRCPGRRSARFKIGHDIDNDRLVGGERLAQRRRDFAGLFDANTAHPETPRDGGEIGWSEADQLLSPPRPVAGDAVNPGQVLAETRVVVDDQRDGDAGAPRRFQFGEVIVEPAIAGEADDLAVAGGAFRAERRWKRPAERARRTQIGLPGAVELDHRAGPDAGIAGVRDQNAVRRQGARDLGAKPLDADWRGVLLGERRHAFAPIRDDPCRLVGKTRISGWASDDLDETGEGCF